MKRKSLIIVSGPPASGKTTLILDKNKLSQILNFIDLKKFTIGVENNYENILKDKNLENLIYHYNVITEKKLYGGYRRIEKLLNEFNNIIIIICISKKSDLYTRFKKREHARKRGITFKTINPFFIYTIYKIYSTYKNRSKIIKIYKNWIDFISNYKPKYIMYNTSKNNFYSIEFDKIKNKFGDII